MLNFLSMSFPREGYSADKFIAYGEEVYNNFSRQTRGPVNVAYHDNSIVLTVSGVCFCVLKIVMPCYGYKTVAHSSYIVLLLNTVEH